MRIEAVVAQREKIFFDLEQLPEGYKDREGSVASAFAFDRVAFGDDLQTAVAKSHGIEDDGGLDMSMLAGVEQIHDYLDGRQGEPVALLDVAHESYEHDAKFVYLAGYIGTILDIPEPVGLVVPFESTRNRKSAGIAVNNVYTNIHGFLEGPVETQHYRSQYLSDQTGGLIPFNSQTLKVGEPGYDKRADLHYEQVIVAGSDIVPWIRSEFSGESVYNLYMDIVQSIVRGEDVYADLPALDSILDEELLNIARDELDALRSSKAIIDDFEFHSENLEAALRGKAAEANIALQALGNQFIGGREPRTSDSYSIKLTDPVNGTYGSQLDKRRKAIEWTSKPLIALTRRANK